MNGPWVIEPAQRSDADGIVAAIRSGFEPSELEMFIYGCRCIGNYVADQIDAARLGGDYSYTVSRHEGRVIGCVELRMSPHDLFLNYVSVLPQYRGLGLATQMLSDAIARRKAGRTGMSLDFLERNTVAQSWYAKLGFSPQQTSVWLTGAQRAQTAADYVVVGAPQAMLLRQSYGFSELRILTAAGCHSVGYLGDKWFRVKQAAALEDPGVAAALRDLDPGRDLLAVLPEDEARSAPAAGLVAVARSVRMSTRLTALCRALNVTG